MTKLLLVALLSTLTISYAQENDKISTIDFVQILNENKEEVLFYYKNNWMVIREKALEKKYIHSYQVLETPYSENEAFQLMLVTTYINQQQSDLSEERFDKLIAEKGPLRLLNEKKPGEFRKVLFNKMAMHLH